MCGGLPWPAGPSDSWMQSNTWFPSSGDRYTVWLARCHMMHVLKQHKEVHCMLRIRESFLLIRKENLGPSNTWQVASIQRKILGPGHWFGQSSRKTTGGEWLLPQYHPWTLLYKSLCGHILYLQYIHGRVAVSYDKCIFNAIWTCQTVFQNTSCCTIYTSTKNVWESQFHILTNNGMVSDLNFSHSFVWNCT